MVGFYLFGLTSIVLLAPWFGSGEAVKCFRCLHQGDYDPSSPPCFNGVGAKLVSCMNTNACQRFEMVNPKTNLDVVHGLNCGNPEDCPSADNHGIEQEISNGTSRGYKTRRTCYFGDYSNCNSSLCTSIVQSSRSPIPTTTAGQQLEGTTEEIWGQETTTGMQTSEAASFVPMTITEVVTGDTTVEDIETTIIDLITEEVTQPTTFEVYPNIILTTKESKTIATSSPLIVRVSTMGHDTSAQTLPTLPDDQRKYSSEKNALDEYSTVFTSIDENAEPADEQYTTVTTSIDENAGSTDEQYTTVVTVPESPATYATRSGENDTTGTKPPSSSTAVYDNTTLAYSTSGAGRFTVTVSIISFAAVASAISRL